MKFLRSFYPGKNSGLFGLHSDYVSGEFLLGVKLPSFYQFYKTDKERERNNKHKKDYYTWNSEKRWLIMCYILGLFISYFSDSAIESLK